MSVFRSDGDRVVPMSAVENHFDRVGWYGSSNTPRWSGVVGLAWSMFVEVAVVNNTPWGSIRLGCEVHSRAPGVRGVEGHSFEYAQLDVSL